MRPIKVITDSSADIGEEQLNGEGIDYVKVNYVVGEKIYGGSLGWTDITPEKLDSLLNSGKTVKTSQTSMSEFDGTFRKYLGEGYDVLMVPVSSKISGSYNAAKLVKNNLAKEYPDARIEILDSDLVGIPLGLLAMYANKLVKEGKSMDEVISMTEASRNKFFCVCTVRSLDHFINNGRVTDKAYTGNLMGIKSILTLDKGRIVPMKKVKGWKQVLDEVVAIVADSGLKPSDTVYISQSLSSADDVEFIKNGIAEKVGCKVQVWRMYTIDTVMCGPDSLIVAGNGVPLMDRDGA